VVVGGDENWSQVNCHMHEYLDSFVESVLHFSHVVKRNLVTNAGIVFQTLFYQFGSGRFRAHNPTSSFTWYGHAPVLPPFPSRSPTSHLAFYLYGGGVHIPGQWRALLT
jgi:hypothetical protein